MKYHLKPKIKTIGCQTVVGIRIPIYCQADISQWDQFYRLNLRGFFRVSRLGRCRVEYTGPVSIPLYDRLREPISKQEFFMLLEQILAVTEQLQHHGLSSNAVLFDLHTSFINVITKELSFLYFPICDIYEGQGLLSFVESIIYSSLPISDDDSESISRFVYFMRSLSYFDIPRIEQFILKEEPQVVARVRQDRQDYGVEAGQQGKPLQSEMGELAEEPAQSETELPGMPVQPVPSNVFSGEDPSGEETCLLCDIRPGIWPRLYRASTEETILVDREEFRIGKDAGKVDYAITDNKAISRKHAEIRKEGASFYISDLNSKNRTYVNETALSAHVERELTDGDLIRLADEEFVFQLL